MLAQLRLVSAAVHASDNGTPCFRRYDYDDDGFVMVYDCDLAGPGVAGGLFRVGMGADRVRRAMRRAREVREDLEEDEPMPLFDKLIVGLDVVIGATNIVIGACDVIVGVSDFVEYARAGLARLRGKAAAEPSPDPCLLPEGGSTSSSGAKKDEMGSTMIPVLCHSKRIHGIGKYDVLCLEDLPEDIILSKLELNEAGKASVVSSKWTNMWTLCRALRFVDNEMFGIYLHRKQLTRKFVENVNAVLALHKGKMVLLRSKWDLNTGRCLIILVFGSVLQQHRRQRARPCGPLFV